MSCFAVSAMLIFCVSPIGAQPFKDTVRVYFELNKTGLRQQEQTTLAAYFANGEIPHITATAILGYTDNLGGETHNDILSAERAKVVSLYLQQLGVQRNQITQCEGKGQIDRTVPCKTGYPEDRRVDIFISRKTPPVKPGQPYTNKLVKYPVATTPVGKSFVLENIYFQGNRHTLVDESYPQLEELCRQMALHPEVKISIEGHVCCIRPCNDSGNNGKEKVVHDAIDLDEPETFTLHRYMHDSMMYYRNSLSINRARMVYQYLVDKGIDSTRMKYIGYGNMRPLVKNEQTKTDQDKNKRVEIRILSR